MQYSFENLFDYYCCSMRYLGCLHASKEHFGFYSIALRLISLDLLLISLDLLPNKLSITGVYCDY